MSTPVSILPSKHNKFSLNLIRTSVAALVAVAFMGWGSSYAQSSGGGKNPQATAELLDTASQWSCVFGLGDDEEGDLRKLLAKGADVNAADGEYGKTALMYAVGQGKFEIAKLLASQGANINAADKEGNTVLMWALRGCEGREGGFLGGAVAGSVDTQSVRLLLEQGANPKAVSKSGETALSIVAGKKKLTHMVKTAIANYGFEKKLDFSSGINGIDANGDTALMRAVKKGDAAGAQRLLEKGAEVDMTDGDGYTPLMRAAEKGNTSIVEKLLRHGADVNYTENSWGHNALSLALQEKRDDIAMILLDKKAKVDDGIYEHPCYISLISLAVSGGNAAIVKRMIEAGADVNEGGGQCSYPGGLLEAAKEHPEIVRILKAAGAKEKPAGD